MASVWQRLSEIVGSASERTGVVGSLVNLIDPDTWLLAIGGKTGPRVTLAGVRAGLPATP